MTADICPINGCNLQGEPIPQEYRDAGHYGDNPPTHYGRTIGVEVSGVYDGVLYWVCPDCGMAWSRWNDGGRRSQTAAAHVAEHNANVKARAA